MKPFISYILFAVAFLAVSCTDNSYRGQWDEYIESINNQDKYPVRISVGPYSSNITTKSGTEEDDVDWSNTDLYIYSFKNDSSASIKFDITRNDDSTYCLVDASMDGDNFHGKKGYRMDNHLLEWLDSGVVEKNIFYPKGLNTYRFYGYTYGDARVLNIHRTSTAIVHDISIDGRQDVMVAYSDPEDTYFALGNLYNDELKEDILKYSYSEFTAKLNVYPQLSFKHLLTKFNFRVVSGIKDRAVNIMVEDIRINSYSDASLVVASSDYMDMNISFSNDSLVWFSLKEKDGSNLDSSKYKVNTNIKDTINVGNSIIAATLDQYEIEIDLKEVETGLSYSLKTVLPTKDMEGNIINEMAFKAGAAYMITFTIYGMMDVDTDVKLVGWKDGGALAYDPEKEDENIPKE